MEPRRIVLLPKLSVNCLGFVLRLWFPSRQVEPFHGSRELDRHDLCYERRFYEPAMRVADSSAVVIASAIESIEPRSHAREYSNSPICSLALASALALSAISAGGSSVTVRATDVFSGGGQLHHICGSISFFSH